jgi:ATP-binding cassette subfamily C protein CydC
MSAAPPVRRAAPLFRLLTFLRPFGWWVVAGILLGFATISSSVGLMAVSAYLIAKAAIAVDVTQLSLAIAGVRLFALTRALFRYGERYVTHLATFRILTALRVWFYRAIEPLAPARLQEVHSGDLLARIGADIETLENFYVRVVAPPVSAVLVMLFAGVLLGAFDVWLGVALVGFLAFTGGVLPWLSRRLSRHAADAALAQRSALNVGLVDLVQGMADLAAYGQAEAQQARVLAQRRGAASGAAAAGNGARPRQRAHGACHRAGRLDHALAGDPARHRRPARGRLPGAAAADGDGCVRVRAAARPGVADVGVE